MRLLGTGARRWRGSGSVTAGAKSANEPSGFGYHQQLIRRITMSLSRSLATGIAALDALFVVSQAADAALVTTTANLNLRAGPGMNHRVRITIPAGSRVDIHSCGTRGAI